MGNNFDINIRTTDDPSGVRGATEEMNKLTDAIGHQLETEEKRATRTAAKEAIKSMSAEEREAALSAYQLAQAQDSANNQLNQTQPAASQVGQTMATLKGSWIELNSAIGVFKEGLATAQQIWASTGQKFLDAADQVKTLKDTIGGTAEQASVLVFAANRVGVSVDALQASLEAAVKKGVDPSMEGLAGLAERYQQIQDPIAQTQFLMENFGKRGTEIRDLMEMTTAQIRQMGIEAERANQKFNQADLDRAEATRRSLEELQASSEGAGIAIGGKLQPAIQAIADVIAVVFQGSTLQARANIVFLEDQLRAGKITWESYAVGVAHAMYTNDMYAGKKQALIKAIQDHNAEAEKEIVKLGGVGRAFMDATDKANKYMGTIGVMHSRGDDDYNPQQAAAGWENYYNNPPGRAAGGPVEAGQLYIVNENRATKGPEYFIAPADGYILPSRPEVASSAGGGGGPTIIVPLDYHPTVGLGDRASLEQALVPALEGALRTLGVKTNA